MKTTLGIERTTSCNIITWYKALVTPGIQHINGITVHDFRHFLIHFLSITHVYHNPAYLSSHTIGDFPYTLMNVAHEADISLENAATAILDCDFIWIELDTSTIEKKWYPFITKTIVSNIKKRDLTVVCLDVSQKEPISA